jgi:hypothetical protein
MESKKRSLKSIYAICTRIGNFGVCFSKTQPRNFRG